MINHFTQLLLGKDLRSIAKSNAVAAAVNDQESFDALFSLIFHHERLLIMRAADAVEKITVTRKEFLKPHKEQLIGLLRSSIHKELKWHLAQLITRLPLTRKELIEVWDILSYWAQNRNESKIVRVNALQGLYDLSTQYSDLKSSYVNILMILEHEPIPSLKARIRKLSKAAKIKK